MPGLHEGRRRSVNVAAAAACFGMLVYAVYSQQFQGLTPCPLCIFQRVGIAALGVAFLLAAIPPAGARVLRRIVALLIVLVAAITAGIAIRHLYIQHLPAGSVPACGASLDYMLDVFPVSEVLRKVLTGSGECAKVDWTFLGLAMPAWVLIWTVVLGVAGVAANWPRRPAR